MVPVVPNQRLPFLWQRLELSQDSTGNGIGSSRHLESIIMHSVSVYSRMP